MLYFVAHSFRENCAKIKDSWQKKKKEASGRTLTHLLPFFVCN